jgi:membrane protease YdiL (CAAX protease family)
MRISQRGCFVAGVVVLLIYNLARGLGTFGRFGRASTMLFFGAFVVLAWLARLSAADLGLARADISRGAVYGIATLLIIATVLVIVALIPATRVFFDDARGHVSGLRLLSEVTVSYLMLTVIPEEFAFRGVLLAAGRELWEDRGASLVISALFGLWHISPALVMMSLNRQLNEVTTTSGTILVVAGAVLGTFAAGLVFCWLRLRSRSLLAPVIAHLTTNGGALLVAWLVGK